MLDNDAICSVMTPFTKRLKAKLWQEYGGTHYAEWSENKVTQRLWEYLRTIDLLELTEDSRLLDIGGGGTGFFAHLVSPFIAEMHVMDENALDRKDEKVVWHAGMAAYDTLAPLLARFPKLSHISCVSVFEHAPDAQRIGISEAINEQFKGDTFVMTLEFHSREIYFGYQLNTVTLSDLCRKFTNFYPDVIETSPLECVNAFKSTFDDAHVMMWKPLIMRFRRI